MKYDQNLAFRGHYIGLTDWLKDEIGDEGIDWCFQSTEYPGRISEIKFAHPHDEILCTLRWG